MVFPIAVIELLILHIHNFPRALAMAELTTEHAELRHVLRKGGKGGGNGKTSGSGSKISVSNGSKSSGSTKVRVSGKLAIIAGAVILIVVSLVLLYIYWQRRNGRFRTQVDEVQP